MDRSAALHSACSRNTPNSGLAKRPVAREWSTTANAHIVVAASAGRNCFRSRDSSSAASAWNRSGVDGCSALMVANDHAIVESWRERGKG